MRARPAFPTFAFRAPLLDFVPEVTPRPVPTQGLRDNPPAVKAPIVPPNPFVTAHGTDRCVNCRADTGIDTNTHVHRRECYIDGMGQFCLDCFNRGA